MRINKSHGPILLALLFGPVWAMEQPDETAENLAAMQQVSQEMAKPEAQQSMRELAQATEQAMADPEARRMAVDAVQMGNRTTRIESAEDRAIVDGCKGVYTATVTRNGPHLDGFEPGKKFSFTITADTCTLGGLKFRIATVEVNGLGLLAVEPAGVTGEVEFTKSGTPVLFVLNPGSGGSDPYIYADLVPRN